VSELVPETISDAAPTENWEGLDALRNEHGPAFYLADLGRFEHNYRSFRDAFRTLYPRTELAYSYKTNYLPSLCRCVDDWGGYAEVVSSMEYELARRIGVSPDRIIFNGPYKRREEIVNALSEGAIVNIDSGYELDAVEEAAATGRSISVGIRCNLRLPGADESRFGFDVESDEFTAAIKRLQKISGCRIVGLHCHLLTRQRSAEDYRVMAERMVALADAHFKDQDLEFLDLGGGFFSPMSEELRKTFSFPVPNYADYASAIAGVFADRWPQHDGPELILEPGISITADIMRLVAEVVDWKTVGERHYALVAGSIYNIKPTKAARQLPMRVVRKPYAADAGATGVVDIVGYTCMEDDVLYRAWLGSVAPGDFAVFDNVGAYTIVLKPPFIAGAPPILSVGSELELLAVLRSAEKMTDVFTTYSF